ncbi:MFS transporter [Curtobacterium sp. 22159]|uniref:MFS transporter n=1 Tax=Curtobacterium sp. 22159 TaxID=3453882 RepID=UPI003F841656
MTSVEPSYDSGSATVRLSVLAAGLFVVGTNAFVIAGVLPDIARSLGAPQSQVSLSITLYAVIVALGSPAVSILLARVDRAHLMAAGLVLIGVGTGVAAAASGVGVFDVGRALAAVGGAALVPTATAAAPTMVPAERRGRAIGTVALGFTFATAVGSPAGTALAGVGGWRLPLAVLAVGAFAVAAAILVLVRNVPSGTAVGMTERLGVLRRPGVGAALVGSVLLTTAFNLVYLFSAAVTSRAVGSDTGMLAVLLLVYGAGGVVGNLVAGRLVDRLGTTRVLVGTLTAQAVVLAVLSATDGTPIGAALTYFAVGVVAFAAVVPLQHLLVELRPEAAGISLSWYSTAMYVGIALAPLIGSAALSSGPSGGPVVVPVAGAVLTVGSVLAVLVGVRTAATPRIRRSN